MSNTYMETNDGSFRFWRVEVVGSKTIVTFGNIGGEGRRHEEQHASAAAAVERAEHLVLKQSSKGFEKGSKRKRADADETSNKSARVTRSEVAETKPKKAAPKKAVKKAATKKATPTKKSPKKSPKKASPKKAAPKKSAAKTSSKKPAAEKKEIKVTGPVESPSATPKKEAKSDDPKLPKVPEEWTVKLANLNYGLHVNDTHVYTGDETGLVQQFDKSGVVQKQYRLPTGVKCIVGDGIFLYVGTHDGCLYDITTEVPRLMSKIEEFGQVYWMAVKNGRIVASDKNGKVALINTEGETIWVASQPGANDGWMCLIDDTGVYHGNSHGVQKRDLTNGKVIWSTDINRVWFGQQDEKYLYVVDRQSTHKINKETGKIDITYYAGGFSAALSQDGTNLITGYPFCVYNIDGTKIQQFNTGYKNLPNSPKTLVTWGDHEVYGVNMEITKYNLSPETMEKIKAGKWQTQSFNAQSLAEVMPETSVEVTSDTSKGIMCQCVKEGGKLRVRVISTGYNKSWNVQFPRDIREEGAKYIVEKIEKQDTYYRAWGDIKKVQN